MKISFYVAASMDGFIARPNGDIDWLESVDGEANDFGYADFYNSIDVIAMGGKTFRQMRSFSPWPYAGKPVWVFSHGELPPADPGVSRAELSPAALVEQWIAEGKDHAWVLGGGEIHSLFLRTGLVDEIRLFIMPIALGEGIPLFAPPLNDFRWHLKSVRSWPGNTAELHYARHAEESHP